MPFYCNTCLCPLQLFTENAPKSYVTPCEHVFCIDCVKKSHSNCGICQRPTKYMEVCKEMPEEWRLLFLPIESSLKMFDDIVEFDVKQKKRVRGQLANKFKQAKKNEVGIQEKSKEIGKAAHKIREKAEKGQIILKKFYEYHKKQKELDRKSPSPKHKKNPIVRHRKYTIKPSQYKQAVPISPRRLQVLIQPAFEAPRRRRSATKTSSDASN